jgi:tocopherol cyclase
MFNYFKRILHPEGYQGGPRKLPHFEGWYFKLVDRTGRHRIAVIPGISISREETDTHCFIQTLDGNTGETTYHTYPPDVFSADRYTLSIRIGPNVFDAGGMTLVLPGNKMPLNGHVAFSELHPWPVKWYAPGIMGWYAWVPFMECYHGVLSFDHIIKGTLQINGSLVNFDEGRGYIEKDWGKSFPSAYIWMQSNHFSSVGTSLSASIANIPWIGSSFQGYIIGLVHMGKLYRFTTYTGAQTDVLRIDDNHVFWSVSSRLFHLEITAHRALSGQLKGPNLAIMARRVPETLQAEIAIKLVKKSDGTVLLEDTGLHGGLEIVGDTSSLFS